MYFVLRCTECLFANSARIFVFFLYAVFIVCFFVISYSMFYWLVSFHFIIFELYLLC